MLCSKLFSLAAKFLDESEGGRREYQDFQSKPFCLTVPKKFVGYSFSISLNLGIKNFILKRLCQDFFSKSFCLTVPKKIIGNISVVCFRKIPVARKFMDKKGGGGVGS